jgi:hypothetical protein
VVVVLGSVSALLAQRIWEQSAEKPTRQMWSLVVVYGIGIAAFFVSWAAVFAVPLAGQVLLGVGVIYVILRMIRGVGAWLWESWDRYERSLAIRGRVPRGEGQFIAGVGASLLGALIAVVIGVGFAGTSVGGVAVTALAAAAVIILVGSVVLTASARASLRSAAGGATGRAPG